MEVEVNIFLQTLNHPFKKEVEEVRDIILKSNKYITKHIKWNAPSFCFKGDDRITFRLLPPSKTQLIFHRGAKVKDNKDFVFEDKSRLIKWLTKDRGIIEIKDIKTNEKAFSKLVKDCMSSTEQFSNY